MEMLQDDDWELDIAFSDAKVFQRKGVYTMEPDKELSIACERYRYQMYAQEYLDDDESETSSSILSTNTYSVATDNISVIQGLDDFMYADQQSMTGVVQRLGNRSRHIQDYNDWDEDVEIVPSKMKGFRDRVYDPQLVVEPTPDQGSTTSSFNQSNSNIYLCEPESDHDELSGLDFPPDMALLPKKLNEKKKGIEVYQCQQETTQQPKSKILASVERERDDDDFCNGLNIKDFHLGKQKKTLASHPMARQKPIHQSRIPQLKPLQLHQPEQPLQKLPIERYRYALGTAASRRREAETRAQSQKLKPKQKVELPMVEKRSANGVLLLSKPKSSKAYGYCFQLDELDNLNTLKSKKKYVLPAKHPKGENEMDPERPWRKNMIKTNQSKIKLIKPNDQDIKKECNGMTFDEKSQSWQGNEKALLAFQDKTSIRRPMLISNRQQTSKYTSVIVNNMIFDTEKLQWVSAFGPEAEHNELDEIEDLKEDTVYRVGKKNNQEFKLSVETKREMMFDQERHESWMKHWPL
ncbi:hypothetical protein BCV72DRAFT_243829 [Rhizopus microsporus var. microsporus]|uniref:Uncharacterized protein n=2 Tax=Rhizopus microsporus TaxID=58291 RepID=A0A2G4SWK3_RHIZD|nr:uncharacterized protein RHIMIDRAFT_237146 [Rhizopus microsporus ATCC 52813]ORE04181.1 hypothetical protein BCV72DRAFT_243829 [Rhizopus microsporus var. microsporus]PHZ13122.1 hypothetical protein RHIMIDRAFT_237146 [Rhizopus microsporus ATCC 52813]